MEKVGKSMKDHNVPVQQVTDQSGCPSFIIKILISTTNLAKLHQALDVVEDRQKKLRTGEDYS